MNSHNPGVVDRGRVSGLLLAPGAGASADHRTLVAVETALDIPVRRMNFDYRDAGRRLPDKPEVAIARIVEEIAEFGRVSGIPPERIAVGGRSYGGRMCSMAVAAGLPAAALVLLSYPLHPPGRPDRLRVEHFPAITVPVLFISGEADAFGSPAEFDAHIGTIGGPVTMIGLPGGHDLRADRRIADLVRDWLRLL